MCDRFHCLPTQVLAEDADLLYLINLEALAKPPEEVPPDDERQ